MTAAEDFVKTRLIPGGWECLVCGVTFHGDWAVVNRAMHERQPCSETESTRP